MTEVFLLVGWSGELVDLGGLKLFFYKGDDYQGCLAVTEDDIPKWHKVLKIKKRGEN